MNAIRGQNKFAAVIDDIPFDILPKYVRVPIPYRGHFIAKVESSNGVNYTVKFLVGNCITSKFIISECKPLNTHEITLVDTIINSIEYHTKQITKIKERIIERENLLKKINEPSIEPFIG